MWRANKDEFAIDRCEDVMKGNRTPQTDRRDIRGRNDTTMSIVQPVNMD